MRNIIFKKIFVSLILIAVLGVITVGCTGTTPPPPTPPPVQTCTLTVYSQCAACWGYVWVNGLSTGVFILQNGMASVTGLTPGTVAAVAIHDNFGAVSKTITIVLVPGVNIVTFDSWL